jgi:hypothetical protein
VKKSRALPLTPNTSTPMRPLIIDEVARAKAQAIIEYAIAHPYQPGPGIKPPGDDPGHWAMFNTFRVVFSFTYGTGSYAPGEPQQPMKFAHISISIPGGKWPNPIAVWSLCDLFGFTGWDGKSQEPPPGWLPHMDHQHRAIVVVQPLKGVVH